MGIEYNLPSIEHPNKLLDVAGHGHLAAPNRLQINLQVISMTQHMKQKAVTNQINQIRNSIKALQHMHKHGFYIDSKQKHTLACITDLELNPLSL